jgi:hypothetical protein
MTSHEPQGFLEDDANVQRLYALGGVSRAGYYRHFGPHPCARDDADLRDLIQRIALTDRQTRASSSARTWPVAAPPCAVCGVIQSRVRGAGPSGIDGRRRCAVVSTA